MFGLTHLLTSQRNTPLTTLSLALPCPALPGDTQRQAQQADARLQHAFAGAATTGPGSSSGGSGGGDASRLLSSPFLASLTPGVAAGLTGHFAESVVLRGPREAGAPLDLGAAGAALDGALAAERVRCVRQRTLVAQPLAVPLPFPHIFARGLSQAGDAPASLQQLSAGGSQDIAACAVLTRLAATSSFGGVVAAAARGWRSAAASAQGQAALESWGCGREEVQEVAERLTGLAHAYDRDEA